MGDKNILIHPFSISISISNELSGTSAIKGNEVKLYIFKIYNYRKLVTETINNSVSSWNLFDYIVTHDVRFEKCKKMEFIMRKENKQIGNITVSILKIGQTAWIF